jgi:hypothetical protein
MPHDTRQEDMVDPGGMEGMGVMLEMVVMAPVVELSAYVFPMRIHIFSCSTVIPTHLVV